MGPGGAGERGREGAECRLKACRRHKLRGYEYVYPGGQVPFPFFLSMGLYVYIHRGRGSSARRKCVCVCV